MLVFPAHGALGPYDELIFLGVSVIFLVMMGISWVRSRNTTPVPDDSDVATQPDHSDPEAPDRFRLD